MGEKENSLQVDVSALEMESRFALLNAIIAPSKDRIYFLARTSPITHTVTTTNHQETKQQSKADMIHSSLFMLIVTFLALMSMTEAFAPTARGTTTARATFDTTPLFMSDDANADDNELVARRIIVTGDVQGGYYRSCVLNEVSVIIVV